MDGELRRAYFAFCVASGTKLMVLYMLTGAAQTLTTNWILTAQSLTLSAASVETAWVIMCGAIIYAGVVWFCSSICSSIFGGSPNLSHSDFVSFMAPAVSAGVTSGLIAAGVLSAGATASAVTAGGAVKAGTAAVTQAAAATGAAAQPAASGTTAAAASNGSGVASAVGQLAQVGANTISRVPHGGSHGAPPSFNGFHH
jgi:type IV secretion system protein TrbL